MKIKKLVFVCFLLQCVCFVLSDATYAMLSGVRPRFKYVTCKVCGQPEERVQGCSGIWPQNEEDLCDTIRRNKEIAELQNQKESLEKQINKEKMDKENKKNEALLSIEVNYKEFTVSGDRAYIDKIVSVMTDYPAESVLKLNELLAIENALMRKALLACMILVLDSSHVEARAFLKSQDLTDADIEKLIEAQIPIEIAKQGAKAKMLFAFLNTFRDPYSTTRVYSMQEKVDIIYELFLNQSLLTSF